VKPHKYSDGRFENGNSLWWFVSVGFTKSFGVVAAVRREREREKEKDWLILLGPVE
jgi:hypothetical protein